MISLLTLISQLITLYIWVIIASVILSWLIAFDIVNIRNRYVYAFANALNRLTEPIYAPIRRTLPPLGGLDLSPMIVIFALIFFRNLMWEIFAPRIY